MSHPPLTRHIGLALALLALGACNGTDNAADTTATAPTSSTTAGTTDAPPASTTISTTTSVSATTSTSSTTSSTLLTVTTPPTSATTPSSPIESVDWVNTLQDLLDLRDQLNAAPDPTRAGEVYAGGALLAGLEEQLANKQQDGVHDEGVDPTVVLTAQVGRVFQLTGFGDAVDVTVVQQYPQNWGRVVDAEGNVVYELVPDPLPTESTVEVTYTMVYAAGLDKWLIALINGR